MDLVTLASILITWHPLVRWLLLLIINMLQILRRRLMQLEVSAKREVFRLL